MHSNGTGRLSYLGAPRPIPLLHAAGMAQINLGLSFALDDNWGSAHSIGHPQRKLNEVYYAVDVGIPSGLSLFPAFGIQTRRTAPVR